MNKARNRDLLKCAVWGIAWTVILCIIALIIEGKTNYSLKDILFMEGIAIIAVGLLSSIGGNPMGVSINALGQNNAQYLSNANLEISKLEKEKIHNNVKTNVRIGLSTISLSLAGVMCIIINFIL